MKLIKLTRVIKDKEKLDFVEEEVLVNADSIVFIPYENNWGTRLELPGKSIVVKESHDEIEEKYIEKCVEENDDLSGAFLHGVQKELPNK